jgi:sensor histidine kinase regulating citrate/malate metabolism
MDEVLLRQLTRQLKVLNFWIATVGILVLAAIIVCIVLLIKVVTFVHNTESQLSDLQQKTSQTLDVKQKLCSSQSVTDFLQNKSSICQ